MPASHVQVSRVKRAFARLVYDRLAGQRLQFGYDVPTFLTSNQNFPARAVVANPRADALAAPAFVGRQIGEVGTMPFAGVHDMKTFRPRGVQHTLNRPDGRARQRKVVAHLVHITAHAAEIRLHINDQHHGVAGQQHAVVRPRIRIGCDIFHARVGLRSAAALKRTWKCRNKTGRFP